jgi:hypothetical protein
MAILWRLESRCFIARTAAGLHEACCFMGSKRNSIKDFPLKEGLAFPTFTDTGKKECTAPNAGSFQQHLASSAHQTGIDDEIFQGYGSGTVSL